VKKTTTTMKTTKKTKTFQMRFLHKKTNAEKTFFTIKNRQNQCIESYAAATSHVVTRLFASLLASVRHGAQ
jgi:hypothetical protein